MAVLNGSLAELGRLDQFGVRLLGVGVFFLWSFGVAFVIFRAVDRIRPLRVTARAEQLGLNVTEHGATTELRGLLVGLDPRAKTGDLSLRVVVELLAEVGQFACCYNRMMDSLQEAGRDDGRHRARDPRRNHHVSARLDTLELPPRRWEHLRLFGFRGITQTRDSMVSERHRFLVGSRRESGRGPVHSDRTRRRSPERREPMGMCR